MKKILFLIALSMAFTTLRAQSGDGYDPSNPGDPNPCYRLYLEASPKEGGDVSKGSTQLLAGQTYYCSASPNFGYDFKHWMMGDSVVSTNRNFYFVMPPENVTLIAYFEWSDDYSPSNPGDPSIDGYSHDVNVYASPSMGGYFNRNYFSVVEGETAEIYAYPNNNFKFASWKHNGKIISTSNPLQITMGDADLSYTAQFVYDPKNPANPSANYFNPSTGELIMDDFEPGNLNAAIDRVLNNYSYSDVQSVVIEGEMDTYDFGFSNYMNNCSTIDLFRTTGYTQIPSWSFEYMQSLTKIILPSTVERIGSYAFTGCVWLSEIICYASVPPIVNENAFDESAALILRVPSSALSLYTQAEIWKDFTIFPLDQGICKLTVNLPDDAKDGRYKNMIIDVNNVLNGQSVRYIITEKMSYTFNNLVMNSKYNVIVKNTSGAKLGGLYDISLTEEEHSVSFPSLLQPRNVSINIFDNNDNDVTSKVTVSWYDVDGKYITQGLNLKGILENTRLKYRINLPKELAMQYVLPSEESYTVKSSDNNVIVKLKPFEEITISGYVKDNANGFPINRASVSITQTLNNKYSKSMVVTTDNTGKFTADIYNTTYRLTAVANDYLANTITVDDIENTEVLNDIRLKEIIGVKINTLFTYTNSVADGKNAEVLDHYSDYENVSYSVYNNTANDEVENINVKYPYIVLMDNVNPGDRLSVTASSRNNMFNDVKTECVVDENNSATVTLPIVELGKLQSDYNSSNSSNVVGILYDSKGQFLKKSNYVNQTVVFDNLRDGKYSLVSMKRSDLFNTILNLSEMNAIGLREGAHYIKNDVTVESGKISIVSINEIYDFDESEFYYTDDETSFTVNKQSVTVGNYVTLRAKVDFKSEFANNISDVKLIFDLPSSCEFVNNSVMVGNSIGSYTLGENRVEVELANINDLVRFCVTPMEGGKCNPTAFVSFKLNGEDVLQPIGSVTFEAKNMEINVPNKTSLKTLVVKGFAPPLSNIVIFDNGVLVGTTKCFASGEWMAEIELNNANKWSYHSIYAEITLPSNQKYTTDTKQLYYSVNNKILSDIVMINDGNEIVFDMDKGTVSNSSYSFVPGYDEFTFIAKFNDNSNDTTLINNFMFLVLTTDGTVDAINGEYNKTKMAYVANVRYPDSDRLPINVTAEYDPIYTSLYDSEANYNDSVNYENELDRVKEYFDNSTLEILVQNKDELYFSLTPEGTECNEYFRINKMDYDNISSDLNGYFHIVNDTMDFYFKEDVTETAYVIYFLDNINREAYSYNFYGSNTYNSDQIRILPMLISAGSSVIFAGIERYANMSTINQWRIYCNDYSTTLRNNLRYVTESLYAKCVDGSLMISDPDLIDHYLELTSTIEQQIDQYESDLTNLISMWEDAYNREFIRESILGVVISGSGGVIGKLIKNSFSTGNLANMFKAIHAPVEPIITGTLESIGQFLGYSLNDLLENPFLPKVEISKWNEVNFNLLSITIYNLIKEIKSLYSCVGDFVLVPRVPPFFPTPPIPPVIDPSGFVYEGVSSNRVEGVMASCYYKEFVEDMYGDIIEKVVLWDAEAYAQENPLFTDENGMYRWDVPQGLWQVKFEKEGYETTYSDWLPVPPPQLEVNIPIVQYSQPNVIAASAYEDAVEVKFDKYMMSEFLTTENILLTVNGENVAGSIELLDEEVSYDGTTSTFASKIRFNAEKPFKDGEVTITVKNAVRSYANIRMQDDFSQTFTVEVEIKKIVCPPNLQINYNEEMLVEVSVIPATVSKGKTLNVTSQAPHILSVEPSSVIIDEEGKVQIKLKGELPGTASLLFGVEGYEVTAQTLVEVVQELTYDSNQITTFNEGWNWYSTYLDIDGLERIKNALGSNAEQIKTQFASISYNNGSWSGNIDSVSTEQMFMVKMLEESSMSISGNIVDPSERPISLQPNWTWFGYMLDKDMTLEEGFVNLSPNSGDYVKSQSGFNTYYDGKWYGETKLDFEVGKGYMYKNTSGSVKTFVYPSNNSKRRYVDNTSIEKHWSVNVNKYPTNMSIIAVVNIGSEEMSGYEIGAFCKDECRGSARPVYVEALGRYLLFLTVHGEGNEEITFRYYDIDTNKEYEYSANETLSYETDAILGTMPNPYVISFKATNVNVNEYANLTFVVYPNPVDRNNEIHLGNVYDRVEVYSSIGVKVAEYVNIDTIDGIDIPGVYVVNAISKNGVKYCRLIVK